MTLPEFNELILQDNREAVEHLLQETPSLTSLTDDKGRVPLDMATSHGRVEIARLLIAHGANVNHRENIFGTCPLLQAVSRRHREMVALLLQHGANPRLQNHEGQTPLSIAKLLGAEEILALLRDSDAEADRPMNFDSADGDGDDSERWKGREHHSVASSWPKMRLEDKITHCQDMLAKATDAAERANALHFRALVLEGANLLEEAMVFHRLTLDVPSISAHSQVIAYAGLASCLNKLGRFADADEAARKGIAIQSHIPVAHRELAISLEKRSLFKEAAREYLEALMGGPRNELHMKEIRRLHREHPGLLESDPDTWIVASLWLALDEPSQPWTAGGSSQRFWFCMGP